MKLTDKEIALYYDLMNPLQYFVSKELSLYQGVNSVEDFKNLPLVEKIQARDALFSDITLIDKFISLNPYKFSDSKLKDISKWKNFIGGEFYIERFLKKYTIFIKNNDVYGVCGLQNSLNELIHSSHLPLIVETSLLPFKGKIIYDGRLKPYNIHFGGNMKRNLKEIYMRAKQNNRIIETFDKTATKTPKVEVISPVKHWTKELASIKKQAKRLRGNSDLSPICGPAFSLLKASIEFAELTVLEPDNFDSLVDSLMKIRKNFNKAGMTIHRQD